MSRLLILNALLLGVSSLISQIIVLRESLAVFSGNELVIGVILANWLLLTGWGAFMGRKTGSSSGTLFWLGVCQLLIGVLPTFQVLTLRFYRSVVMPGLMLGLGETFGVSFVVLLPYCLVSGFLLAFLSKSYREIGGLSVSEAGGLSGDSLQAACPPGQAGSKPIAVIYAADSLGGIIGGITFSYVLVFVCSPLQSTLALLLINCLGVVGLYYARSGAGARSAAISLVLVAAFAFGFPAISAFEKWSLSGSFPGQEILEQRPTPYASIVVTRQGGQLNVYSDGQPIGSSDDPISAEETVHYALAQPGAWRKVLLLSGGLSGAIDEVLKYPGAEVDYVELDPVVIALTKKVNAAYPADRVRMQVDDPRVYLRSKVGAYDAVLMAFPDPISLQLNRFYSREFFALVKQALRNGEGVFSFTLSGPENYVSAPLRLLASSVYRALGGVFKNVIVIPGARQVFVASDRPLSYDVASGLKSKGVGSAYVNEKYLRAKLTADRIALARQAVSMDVAANRDFSPVGYYATIKFWLSFFTIGFSLPLVFIALVLVFLAVLAAKARNPAIVGAVAGSGFVGLGLEVVLIVVFQILYGSLYHQVGVIITAFLVGAVIGAALFLKKEEASRLDVLQLDVLLAALALILPVFFTIFSRVNDPEVFKGLVLVFSLLNALIGGVAGAQFAAASAFVVRSGREVGLAAGELYAADFLGACLGAVMVGTFCVPLFGVLESCLLLGALKLGTALWLRYGKTAREISAPLKLGWGLSLGVMLLVPAGLGVLILDERGNDFLYALSLAPFYHWTVLLLAGLGIAGAIGFSGRRFGLGAVEEFFEKRSGFGAWRWLNYLAFSLVVFYPLFRCFFKIPYLFCHVCPRKCVFGYLRPYLVPAALIMNLENRHWCYHACPIGTLHDAQACSVRKVKSLGRILWLLPLAIIAFTAWIYFKIRYEREKHPFEPAPLYNFFFVEHFKTGAWVLAASGIVLLLSWRYRRVFCMLLCPVGNFSELLLKLERMLESLFRAK